MTFFLILQLSAVAAFATTPLQTRIGKPLISVFEAQGVPAEALERAFQYLDQNAGRTFTGGSIGNTTVHIADEYMVIIDYSLPSTEKRLYHLNLKTGEVQKHLVAHGKNSGVLYSIKFSDSQDSKTSSLGLSLVAGTYEGFYGTTLRLYGVEESNNSMEPRYIVMHGAPYVSQKFIDENSRLGRSWGCPAVGEDVIDLMIATLQPGSIVYLYHKDLMYVAQEEPERQINKDPKIHDLNDIDLPGEEEDIQSNRK
ncbi:MAG: murein L,D-transpeptidase catalytic domain family protein [Bdellovibrionaceae bacterium]|nr:murein L,D-transpeptidase catalytic domain family protein [Pseudobdellovibrionaceae bacterium]